MIPGLNPDHLLSTKLSMRVPTATQQSNSTFMHRILAINAKLNAMHIFSKLFVLICVL